MRYLMFLLGLMFANVAQAMNCQELPDCESLGYSKGEDPNCVEDGYLNCPFDQDYKVCVQYNCEALGFTESDKTSWCADLIECKGNSKMTLCQKPCFATDAQSLIELAGSGQCKVVTMRNDISIPANQNLTLAKNTTLDGSGHTITATFTSFKLLDGAKLKNLHIHRKIDSVERLIFITVQGNGFFEDISVLDENNNTVLPEEYRWLCQTSGTLTLSGVLKFEVKNDFKHHLLEAASLVFENAKVELIGSSSSDAFVGHSTFAKNYAKNSEIHIQTKSFVVSGTCNGEFELVDSKMIVENDVFGVVWKPSMYEYTFKLGKGGYLDTKENTLVYAGGKLKFIFNGTAEKPATLIIGKKYTGDMVTLDVQNTAATLNYMGIVYHPTKVGTTLLENIPTSPDWEHE